MPQTAPPVRWRPRAVFAERVGERLGADEGNVVEGGAAAELLHLAHEAAIEVYALTMTTASGCEACSAFAAASTLTVLRSTVPVEWIFILRRSSASSVRPASP